MIVSVSAVFLLGALVYLLWRYANLQAWQAVICILFGYLLASSSVGPFVGRWLASLLRFIAGVHL